jgi:hypothetical protein
MKKCIFELAWIGQCKEDAINNSDFCKEHITIMCVSCGRKATQECSETGTFVCGAPLCDDCEHTIAEDGTNGGIGFYRVSPLPEGFKSHCKKVDQFYKPWYMRETTLLIL